MLTPKHFGILAQLVHDAIQKYPEPENKEAILKRIKDKVGYEIMPWEQYVKDGILVCRQLDKTFPSEDDIVDEIELLVTYYGDRITLVQCASRHDLEE